MDDYAKAQEVFQLLQQVTSIQIVSDFLKKKGLNHSAQSWDKLFNVRLLPYLESREITVDDLVALLRDAEEYGRQHVFLYSCKELKADELMSRNRVESILKKLGIEELLESPRIIDQPSTPTITDIRWESERNNKAFVIKIVEQRVYHKLLEETALADDIFIKKYQKVKERAVNLFKLHCDGLLEIRLASHTNSSNYSRDLNNLKKIVEDFVTVDMDFSQYSLARAKEQIWKDRERLQTKIKYTDITFTNDQGTKFRAASGSDDINLSDDEGAISGISGFMKHNGYCDK